METLDPTSPLTAPALRMLDALLDGLGDHLDADANVRAHAADQAVRRADAAATSFAAGEIGTSRMVGGAVREFLREVAKLQETLAADLDSIGRNAEWSDQGRARRLGERRERFATELAALMEESLGRAVELISAREDVLRGVLEAHHDDEPAPDRMADVLERVALLLATRGDPERLEGAIGSLLQRGDRRADLLLSDAEFSLDPQKLKALRAQRDMLVDRRRLAAARDFVLNDDERLRAMMEAKLLRSLRGEVAFLRDFARSAPAETIRLLPHHELATLLG